MIAALRHLFGWLFRTLRHGNINDDKHARIRSTQRETMSWVSRFEATRTMARLTRSR